jgi:predicted AAA+ superfamily ATPase
MAAFVYLPRVVDQELADRLAATGAVVVEGPKACGKTATARQLSASEIRFDVDQNAVLAATVNPQLVLDGPKPRLLDEWQLAPEIWNHVRRAVEDQRQGNLYILTGSARPADDVSRHSGAGRITRLRMRTMSLFESGFSTGDVSLRDAMNGGHVEAADPGYSLQDVVEQLAHGGWPGWHTLGLAQAQRAVRDYLGEIARVDLGQVSGRRTDPSRVRRLLRSFARNLSTYASISTLAADAKGADGTFDREVAGEYLATLNRLMIVEDQPSWEPHLRSRYRLRRAGKRHFVDPSLAVAALGASRDGLLRDLNLLGLLFESLVVRDLRIYAQAQEANVLQYHDEKDLEVDAIVECPDGSWAALEVKLGGRQIDEGADSLLRFVERLDTTQSGEPVLLAVIVATGYAYKRPDGVAVIPITTLKP